MFDDKKVKDEVKEIKDDKKVNQSNGQLPEGELDYMNPEK
jgi:hypothetical protein